MTVMDTDEGQVITLSPEKSWLAFDTLCQQRLGPEIDARTFIQQWRDGTIDPERDGVAFLLTFLTSFTRPDKCG